MYQYKVWFSEFTIVNVSIWIPIHGIHMHSPSEEEAKTHKVGNKIENDNDNEN